MLDAWVSRRDLQQLLEKCIEAQHIKFAIVHGLSANRFLRMDLSETRELLNYEPQDDLTEINPKLRDKLALPLRVLCRHSGHRTGSRDIGHRSAVSAGEHMRVARDHECLVHLAPPPIRR